MPDWKHIRRVARSMSLLAALAVCLCVSGAASAATTYLIERTLDPVEYVVSGELLVTLDITITSDGNVNSVGVEETVPPGWTFAEVTSGITPIVQPLVGKDGLLEFAWFPLPPLPNFSFTYRLNVAPDSIGTQTLSAVGIAFVDQVETRSAVVETASPRSGSGTPHDADQDDDFILSLTELLRVVQFFTLGAYSCPLNPVFTEDGFFAGPQGTQLCAPHDSDFADTPDYSISLVELLRLIQIYNAGTYHSCADPESDDGFCAGPPA